MKAYEFLNILEKRFPNKVVYKRLSNDFEIESLISNTNLADLFANKNKGFIALKGKNDPLESFIHKILEIKPVLIISDKNCNYHKVPPDINLIVFEDLKQDLAEVLRIFYGDPKLNLFGVTGTNGKTTITTLLYNIFVNLSKEDPNFSAGLIGTIKYSFNGLDLLKSSISTIPLTTPDIATNYHLLNLFYQKNVKNVFMEVSSHSLDQGRIEGLNFSITAFTNLSQDHLDYHKTMQNYFEAKKKLFFCYSSNFKIINTYNYYGRILYRELVKKNFKNLINFTIRDSKTFFENERFYSYFTLSFYDPLRNELITEKVETDLIGRYNFENLSIVFIAIYFLVNYFLDLGDRRGYYLARAKELIRDSSSFWRDLGRLELISYSPFVF
ncbi:MAG: Mur ligase family protein, partial [bacterium]